MQLHLFDLFLISLLFLGSLVTSLNAFLPLLNGTQFGAILNTNLGAALIALEIANKELEAWSRQNITFKQLLNNQTAVSQNLGQLGASTAQIQAFMGAAVKPDQVMSSNQRCMRPRDP